MAKTTASTTADSPMPPVMPSDPALPTVPPPDTPPMPIPMTPAMPAPVPETPTAPSTETPPAEKEKKPAPITDFPLIGGGLNPIIDQYNALITLAIHLKSVDHNEKADMLYNTINQQIMQIDTKLRQDFSYSDTLLNACRYAICCLLDEIVLEKPWLTESPWQQTPLVQKHFANTLAPHKFYHVLKRLLLNPTQYREAIETFYLCLMLGFQGSSEASKTDIPDRDSLIEKTQNTLRPFWQPPQDQLSQHKKHLKPKPYQIEVDLPLWPIYLITLITLITLYWTLRSSLDADVAFIIEQLRQLGH